MRSLTYTAIFEPSADGGAFSVYFPDLPGCVSCGDDFLHAKAMATEALELHINGLEEDGETLPQATMPPYEDMPANALLAPITIYPDIVANRYANRAVKANLTVPAWLKDRAIAEGLRLSEVFESALMERLGINAAAR